MYCLCAVVFACCSFCEWIVKRCGQSERDGKCRKRLYDNVWTCLRTVFLSVTEQLRKWRNLSLLLPGCLLNSHLQTMSLSIMWPCICGTNLLLYTTHTAVTSALILLYLLPPSCPMNHSVYIYIFFSLCNFNMDHQTAHVSLLQWLQY